jgi:hypothetical protein
MVDTWRKIRDDGSTGLLALLSGVSATIRGGRSLPQTLRLRWSLRETHAELEAAYAELGKYLADVLNAGGSVEAADERARDVCRRIDELLATERRLRDELSRGGHVS